MNKNKEEVDFKVDMSKSPEEIQKEHQEKKATAEKEVAEKKDAVVEEKEIVEEPKEEKKEEKEEVVQEKQKAPEISEKSDELTDKESIIKDYLASTYNIDESQLKDVLKNNENQLELPEEVVKYLEYNKDTKRGLADFVAAQQNFDEMDDISLIGNYLAQTNPEYSDEDIEFYLEDTYGVSEEEEERSKKSKALAMKKELQKAKDYFSNIREKYHTPLESSAENVPEDYKKALDFYKQYNDESTKAQAIDDKRREFFTKNTKKYFNDEFKGFEFNVGEKKLTYKPKNVEETVNAQSDLGNFINKYLDEDGNLVNAKDYHTALSMAMNPLSYAKFFYEQGKADAVNDVVRDGKNVNMNVRTNVDTSTPGPKFRVLQDTNDFGRGLKIKSKK